MLTIFAKDNNRFIAAICAAPKILNDLRLVDNKKITHYPEININFNKVISLDKKVVVDENIITGRSIGTAFEFALKLIEILKGKSISEQVKKQLAF